MKFNMNTPPRGILGEEVRVGNVYPAKGPKPTVAWVVIGIRNSSAILLGIDAVGEICSVQTYYTKHLQDRPVIGRCDGVEDLSFNLSWFGDI